LGFWPAAVITSLIFAALHLTNAGENALGIAAVFAGGLAFCLMLRVSGSLWLGIGFHAAWDWAQSFVYGTPDSGFVVRGHLLITHAMGDPRMSGGTDGPEGSLLAQPVLLIGVLLLVFLYRLMGLSPRPSA
jgi:membrane protease YdiL (CAAX protease family)